MSSNTRDFNPRPDAHAAQWDELFTPVQKAIRELLTRVLGAIKGGHVASDGHHHGPEDTISNCFLVYGERGTGKSTVLLNAAKAVANPDKKGAFFSGQGVEKPAGIDSSRDWQRIQSSIEYAGELHTRGVVWLDMLDLEPLPAKTNLLTILLTRVRDALDQPGYQGAHMAATSRFEEDSDGARQKLNRLISDAALMWEEITETDTRLKANRQVAAAEIYAVFHRNFLDAMKGLSEELGARRGCRDCHPAIVLPIDNIDRSTEHLYGIIKLAQMVSCRHLFLVMAGDRVDVEAFLERAYWKELISVGRGAGASGKTGVDGEDEAFVMARRQSNAAAQKLLPQSHRVEVQQVRAAETLGFCPKRWHGCTGPDWETENTIRGLFGKIVLHSEHIRIDEKDKRRKLTLLHLFDVTELVGKAACEEQQSGHVDASEEPACLTHAADYGLHLAARRVFDLWQLAYWEVGGLLNSKDAVQQPVGNEGRAGQRDQPDAENGRSHSDGDGSGLENEGDKKASKIARTMLRNIIAESGMSSRMSHFLQERLILRNAEGGTVLDFYGVEPEKRLKRLTKLEQQYRFQPVFSGSGDDGGCAARQQSVRSTLRLNEVKGLFLSVRDANAAASLPGKGKDDFDIELPPAVTAWLSVLHDVARWAKDSSVIGFGDIPTAPKVEVVHEVTRKHSAGIDKLKLRWPAPKWGSFVGHNIFHFRWKQFVEQIKKCNSHLGDAMKDALNEQYRLQAGLAGAGTQKSQKQTARKLVKDLSNLTKRQAKVMDIRIRLLVYGWVACALETFFTLSVVARSAVFGREFAETLTESIVIEASATNSSKRKLDIAAIETTEDMAAAEQALMAIVVRLYARIVLLGMQRHDGVTVLPNRQSAYMRDWLERKLPLLLCPLYLPAVSREEAQANFEHLSFGLGKDSKGLWTCWSANAPFIQAKVDADLLEQLLGSRSTTAGDGRDEEQRRRDANATIDCVKKINSSALFGMPGLPPTVDQESR